MDWRNISSALRISDGHLRERHVSKKDKELINRLLDPNPPSNGKMLTAASSFSDIHEAAECMQDVFLDAKSKDAFTKNLI